jgi:hypothetical protein
MVLVNMAMNHRQKFPVSVIRRPCHALSRRFIFPLISCFVTTPSADLLQLVSTIARAKKNKENFPLTSTFTDDYGTNRLLSGCQQTLLPLLDVWHSLHLLAFCVRRLFVDATRHLV